jgi:hypothetical protein
MHSHSITQLGQLQIKLRCEFTSAACAPALIRSVTCLANHAVYVFRAAASLAASAAACNVIHQIDSVLLARPLGAALAPGPRFTGCGSADLAWQSAAAFSAETLAASDDC